MFDDNYRWSFVQKKGCHNFCFRDFEAWALSVWNTLLITSTAGTSLLYFGQKLLLISKWILCIITNNLDWLFCRYWNKTLKLGCFEILGKLRILIWICGLCHLESDFLTLVQPVAMTVWKAIGRAAAPWCSPMAVIERTWRGVGDNALKIILRRLRNRNLQHAQLLVTAGWSPSTASLVVLKDLLNKGE